MVSASIVILLASCMYACVLLYVQYQTINTYLGPMLPRRYSQQMMLKIRQTKISSQMSQM